MSNENKYIISGVSGKIGSALTEQLAGSKYIGIYHNIKPKRKKTLSTYVSIDLEKGLEPLEALDHDHFNIFIHLAAQAHIDKCQEDANLNEKSLAWKRNVIATQNVVNFCKKHKKRLIFFSTECIFDGQDGNYKEKDRANPTSWYGITKLAAEKIVTSSELDYLIIRPVMAYGGAKGYPDILHNLTNQLKKNKRIKVVSNQLISPTHIQDMVSGTIKLISMNLTGIFHLSNPEPLTPFIAAQLICKKLGLKQSLVVPISLSKFFGPKKANLRLKNSTLNSNKFIQATGITPLSFLQGVEKEKVKQCK